MDEALKEQLKKRLKSLGWRAGCFVAIGLLSFVSDNLLAFKLPVIVQAVLGLLLSEITKWLNTNTELFGAKK